MKQHNHEFIILKELDSKTRLLKCKVCNKEFWEFEGYIHERKNISGAEMFLGD